MKQNFPAALEHIATALMDQNAAWDRIRAAIGQMEGAELLIAPELLAEFDRACTIEHSNAAASVVSAIRA